MRKTEREGGWHTCAEARGVEHLGTQRVRRSEARGVETVDGERVRPGPAPRACAEARGVETVGGGRGGAMRPGPAAWCRWAGGAALGLALALALEALARAAGGRWRRRPVREVLFFPSRVTCTEALLAEPGPGPCPCACALPHGDSALSRLLRRLLAARRSLELCVFAFSSPQLARAVHLLHRRGVRVRVVTDADYMAVNGSQIGRLRLAGARGGGVLWDGWEQGRWEGSWRWRRQGLEGRRRQPGRGWCSDAGLRKSHVSACYSGRALSRTSWVMAPAR